MRLLSLLAIAATAVRAAEIDYAAVLQGLWTQTDTDGDTKLSLVEFEKAMTKLGIEASIFTEHNSSTQVFFNDIDRTGDGGITTSELAAVITDYPEYKDPMIAAFTNGAGQVPTSLPAPSSGMVEATSKVKMSVKVSGTVGDIYPGTRTKMKEFFADICDVPVSDVIMTFLDAAPSERARKLQSGGEVLIEGTAYVADDAAVDAALAALPADASDFGSIPAFEGLTVTEVTTEGSRPVALPMTEVIMTGAVLFVAGLAICFVASFVSKSKAKAAGAQGGCCKAGCCSYYAVKPWAFGEFISCVAIAITVFFLYSNMAGLTNVLIGLIELIVEIATDSSPALAEFTSAIPSDLVGLLNDNKSNFSLFPIAVMLPGALAIIFLFFGSVFPVAPGKKGKFLGTKCCIFLADIVLLLCLIFYSIFAGIAVIIKFAPPQVQSIINQVTGVCETVPPMINQLIADNGASLAKLSDAGQDVAELQSKLDEVDALAGYLTEGCTLITGMIDEAIGLFLPGVMCICAIVFAIYVNNTLCCAAGCCCGSKPKAGTDGGVKVEV